ncbi:MAG: hypothetical protein IJ634_06945 [Bacteroidales bacterium]|nr:hypothetical protein [Bacteroidales bacterium]
MKKIAILLFAAVALCLGSCSKDKDDNNSNNSGQQDPAAVDMVNTTWQGSCTDYVTHPQAGQLPAVMTMTMDFNENNQGEMMMALSVGGQEQAPQTFAFTYQFDGLEGSVTFEEGTDHITVDPYNMTYTMEVGFPVGFSREEPQQVGGTVVFHKIH